MKKNLLPLCLLLLTSGQILAQVSDTWKTNIETIFQNVNRSYVTTGLLNDYGIHMTNIEKFTGIPSDSNYIERTEWESLYVSMFSCKFNTNANLPEPATLFDLIDTTGMLNSGVILFSGLHLKYERFKDNAVSSNLVYISNNKIYDTPGRPTTPYEIREAFAVVPTKAWLKGASHTFLFKPELFVSNTGKNISTIQVDFGTGGGYQTTSLNSPVTVTYSTEGEKIIRVKITYTDNSYKESRTKIYVTDIPVQQQNANARYSGANTSVFNFPLSNFSAPKAYQGKIAEARVTVEYTNTQHQIRRPLIVVEGFDGWNILTPNDPDQNFSFEDFISANSLGRGINVQANINHNGNFYFTLSDALQGENYDLIFIDFNDATDYIQRNAYLVENVIEWVNSVKQPLNGQMQKNVVMGFSMGGLVARYALRDMEVTNKAHDTRLYCSFDSPHQGANIPVGFQALISHLNGVGVGFGLPGITYSPGSLTLGRLIPELGRAYKLLNRPAAQQMILYSVVGTGNQILIDNSAHTTFMNEYTQLGYPQQGGIRNLVIASGSECGVDQGFAPYTEFLNYGESERLPYLINLVANLLSPIALFTTYPQIAIGGNILTTSTDFKKQFIVNSLPNQSAQRIYKGKVWIKRKILFVIDVNITIFNKDFYSQSSFLPLDNVAGGVYDINTFGIPAAYANRLNITRYCFIPTFSSLDIGGGAQSIGYSDLIRAYSPSSPPTAPKNVKAANFFVNPTEGGIANQIHTQVTLRNGQWIFNEMEGIPSYFSCGYACASLAGSISGPALVCSSNSSFTFSGLPAGVSINWSRSSNLAYVSGQGTLNYAVKATGTGLGTVSATLNGVCGSAPPIVRSVNVSTGSGPSYIDITSDDCHDQEFETEYGDGANIYTWSINTLPNGPTYLYTNRPYFIKTSLGSGTYKVNVGSACSSIATATTTIYISCGNSLTQFSVYPNPTSDALTISASSILSQTVLKSSVNFEACLMDNSGQTVLSWTRSKGNIITLDLTSLRRGEYVLQIRQNNEVSTQHILID